MAPLRSGPGGRTDGVGEYKTPGMRDSIRAQGGRARSALFYRVKTNEINFREEMFDFMLRLLFVHGSYV